MRRAEVQQARRGIEKESLLLLEQQSGALPEASRLAEAERLRRQAEERHRAEQEQLRIQIDKLSRVADEVAARKASIEIATKNAEAEAEELAEAYARMQAAEEIRRQTEIERARLEEQILSSVKEEGHLLEETRARLPKEHRIDEFGIERLSQNESRQLADFEEFRGQQELEARKRSVTEQQILSEIERMAEAEADARRRIEHADLRRRAAEDACRQVEEKARKVEAEARRRVIEEEQALAKLETIRLDADAAVQARAEQERRIKEEIEQLRRLAEEAGLRIGAEARRRVQAEARLHEERQRLSVEESDRLKVERQHHLLVEQAFPATEEDESFWRDEPGENLRRIESPPVPGDK
jgi:HAMP domain-containing protein